MPVVTGGILRTMSKAKAVIWDMDGVIADTASYHFKAWQEVLVKLK